MWHEHQDAVDQLLVQYRILKSQVADMAELADLIENDWLNKLDKLTDRMLDESIDTQFYKGMMCAYKIMQGEA